MDDERLRKCISVLVNRSNGQSKELFDYCEQDVDMYIRLETLIALKCPSYVPGNKETLLDFMLQQIDVKDEEFEVRYVTESDRFYMKEVQYPSPFVEHLLGKTASVVKDLFKKYTHV